ncbi:MAG: hypothetical protein K0S07_1726, partial [Chlamydiales bacterium]|nr:hypothetical protein [Chlamydiales bacterium]
MVHLRKQKHWLPLLKGHQPYAHITREGSIVEQAGLEQTAAFASGCGACQIFDLFPQEEHLSLAKKVSLCVYKKSVFSGRIPLKNGESCLYYLVPVKKHPLKAKACLYLVREASHLEQDERLKAIGKVTAGVAHDLNNIFTGILSMVQLLKWQTSDAKLLKIEESIEASLERAASITRHITYSLKEETAAAICPTNAL